MDRFREPDDKDMDEYSTCAGCKESIYIGEYYYDIYGLHAHDDFGCVRKVVEARLLVAGDDIDNRRKCR